MISELQAGIYSHPSCAVFGILGSAHPRLSWLTWLPDVRQADTFSELHGRKLQYNRALPHSNARRNFSKKPVVSIISILKIERDTRCPQAPISSDRHKRNEAKNLIISWIQKLVFG